MVKNLLLFFACIHLSLSAPVLEVTTSSGVVRGTTQRVLNKTVNAFFNIPYAEPPVGELRFRKPIPLKHPKQGVIDGTKKGKGCYQYRDQRQKNYVQSEDCLYLNVWTEAVPNTTALRPVMFFIHGGGFHSGSGVDTNGQVLATYGVVMVSVNYRLGPFGFLYGGDDSAPGNVGLFDQNLAIKWVRQNIHSFGGDPNQITIFGQSAGSWSVSSQILSPYSKGLFKRAILESGSVYNNKDIPNRPPSLALSEAKSGAKHFNCTDSHWLECLRKVDAKQLNDCPGMGVWAVPETDFLPLMPIKAFEQHKYSTDIDLMAGVMANEGTGLVSDYMFDKLKTRDDLKHLIGTRPFPYIDGEKTTDFYLKRQTNRSGIEALKWAFYDFYGDIYITCPTYQFAKHFAQSSPKKNVFFYEWTYIPSYDEHKEKGVPHGAETSYVFGGPVLKNLSDKKFSEDTMKMWTNFAKYSQPMKGFPDSDHWPMMLSSGKSTKSKDMNPAKVGHIIDNIFDQTCDGFWKSYYN